MKHLFHQYLRSMQVLLFASLCITTTLAWSADQVDYKLDLVIDPSSHELTATTKIVLPADLAGKTIDFLLTDAVEITSSNPAVKRLPADDVEGFTGINGGSSSLVERGNVIRYQLVVPDDNTTVEINYSGAVYFELSDERDQYTRGFRETAGIIGEEGIFLAGSSLWYPYFSNELITFDLVVNTPEGWHLISQGNGTSRDEDGMARWNSGGAVDEIYLVGGPLVYYQESAGAIEAQVYLHENDDALAKKYLTATAQYLEMYRGLIGPYPYGKFALVENFWETGYGMPSFTLLGPQIIRFPFILTSSYPHEILHNWWGNSVFVSYETGNWAEGLTAYMADSLMSEQRGTADIGRRDTLKKYRDFAAEGNDFPLTEFRSRHSAATAAVGYGKTSMGFHMLRLRMGDDLFRRSLQTFYRDNRGKKASFDDVRAAFEKVSEQDLATFFTQWVEWTGAPELVAANVTAKKSGSGYTVTGNINQLQDGEAYDLVVPLMVTTESGLEIQNLAVSNKSTNFTLTTQSRPLLLEVDPEFDMFRLLDARETSPSIGQIFGDPEILAVIPSAADAKAQAAYRKIAEGWQTDVHNVTVVMDTDIDSIPEDRAAWVFGYNNRLAATLFQSDSAMGLEVGGGAINARGEAIPLNNHSAVIIRRHPDNVTKAVGWIVIDPIEAFPGVQRKLPHYGRHSYLGFEGTEPSNMVKGEWSAIDSPLRIDLRTADEQAAGPVTAAEKPVRKALAELPPVFSQARLMEHVEVLASDELAGRGLGTPELEIAADYIAAQFEAAGVTPGGDDNTWFQTFRIEKGDDGKPHDVRNVIGYIQGTNPDYDGQAVLVTAHYDHLGLGGANAREGESGKIHNGADDNASGVSVMIELMKSFASSGAPERTLVFIGFTAEEAGLIGSRYYTEHATPVPLEGIMGVINLDTLGRLGDKDVTVFSTGSAKEWSPIFMGVGFTTGIGSKRVAGVLASSDQQSFIEKGIPAVQISTGANLDYHRPSDTADKVDGAGLVKIAMFVKEAMVYLASRPEPLTATISVEDAQPTAPPAPVAGEQRKRASFGSVPDFTFQGAGMRFDMVVPASPADKAGFKAGDILQSLNGKSIADLSAFTESLRELSPGDTVSATVLRDGEEVTADVTVTAR